MNVATLVSPFDAGIFLDNSEKHRNDVLAACTGKITAPIVPETSPELSEMHTNSSDFRYFLRQLSTNTKESAAKIFIAYRKEKESYDPNSGINATTVQEIKEWVDANKKKRLVALFDFDRTLTVMEGGLFLKNSVEELRDMFEKELVATNPLLTSAVNEFNVLTFAEYLAGGTKRLEMLQEMFDFLYTNNVTIILLTNNTACSSRRSLFKEIVEVFTQDRPFEIICGMEFLYDKGKAVQGKETDIGNLKSLRNMCIKKGGYRPKTKKKRHMKKKTKKTKH